MKVRNALTIAAILATAVLFFACGGGGGGGTTPTEPTATYAGAATVGDIFTIEMDYPAVGKATIKRSATDGTLIGTKELTYTASGNAYTFTDSSNNHYKGFMVPDTMLAMFVPEADVKDIIISLIVDDTIKTAADLAFLKDKNYLLTQFRHDEKGTKWVNSNIAADGVITGHHANEAGTFPIDLDDVDTTNDFIAGMNLDNLVYNADTKGFTLTVGDEIWTFYYTKSGIGVIDRGSSKGIRFNDYKGTSKSPAEYGIVVGAVYDTLFYGRQSEADEGTTQGTITVTEVGADYFVVDIDNGRDPVVTGVQIQADPSDVWMGFFRVGTDNAVVQLVGSEAFIFAGKMGPWKYEYGIGVKR